MSRLLLILAALIGLAQPASAQLGGFLWGSNAAACTGGYQGPGDVTSGWMVWGGLRAFSCATAGTKAANICNNADANCADVNTLANGNFDVATAQGAPLNCGGTGGTCTVKTLYDKSGNANDGTNATISTRPTLVFNCLNTSLPCMDLGATGGHLTGGDVGHALPLTMAAVAKRVANTSGTILWAFRDNMGSTQQIYLGWPNAANTAAVYDNGTTLTATASDASFHGLIGALISGAGSMAIYVDGTATTGTITTPGVSFGGWGTSSDNFTGEEIRVAETGLINAGLNSTQAGTLCNNQRLYWGTGGTC